MLQLLSLYRLYRDSKPGQVHNYPVRLVNGDVSPFSFWRSIYVNPEKLSGHDLEKVLEHEHIHVSQWHTLDILLAELSTVFYWFNPGIWLMKKAVRENIEFITDRRILQKGADSKQYQYSLLTVSMAGTSNTLVNNFNISTIKKRIIMMNAKRSSRISLGRYLFVAPAVVILLLVFSISKAQGLKKGLSDTIHSLTKAITSAQVNNYIHSGVKTAITRNVAGAKIKPALADTIYHGKSKDGKRSMMVTSTKGLDSTGYVINGAKSTREELLALDPAKVYSIDMVSADIAKKYVDFTLEKPQILFVTTDGSEKGMELKKRLDKALRYGAVAGSGNMALAGSDNIAPAPPGATTAYSYSVNSSSSNNAPEVAAVGSENVSTSAVYITGKPTTVSSKSITINGKPVTVIGKDIVSTPSADEIITIDSNGTEHRNYIYKDRSPKKVRVYAKKAGADGDSYVFLDKPNNETRIDNFNKGVLYIIDGKESKNLKGIAADDIASITSLSDEAARKKYGDKGQHGVIVVTTKKGNK